MNQRIDLSISPLCLTDLQTKEDMVKQYGFLEQAMIQAGGDQIITPLPEADPGESIAAYSNSRLNVITNRLFLLGYLDTDAMPLQLDETYQNAVKAYQRDAFGSSSLKADGWVGEKTWSALQEMVSFEEPSNLAQWFADGEPCKALIRATHLRLYALGLTSRAPGHRKGKGLDARLAEELDARFDKGSGPFKKFCEIAQVLEWEGARELIPDKSYPFRLKTFELLFDQDELVKRLASVKVPTDKKTIKSFICSMVKIELWLHGYDIQPKGYAGRLDKTMQHDGLALKVNSQLYKQLVKYWADVDKASPKDGKSSPELKALLLVKSSFPDFFASLADRFSEEIDDEIPDSERVYQKLKKLAIQNADKTKETDIVQKIWNHVYSLGARIWDGIKRAWHWFKRVLEDAVDAVEVFVKKISRIAYQYILKAYEAAKAVIRGVAGSLSFFAHRMLPLPKQALGTPDAKVVIGRDMDFDFKALVDIEDRPEDIQKLSEYLEHKSSLFSISCRFLGEFLHVILKLLKSIWGVTWVTLLMALLRLYKSIARLAPEIISFVRKEDNLLLVKE